MLNVYYNKRLHIIWFSQMEELLKSHEQLNQSKASRFIRLFSSWIAAIFLVSCNPPSVAEAEGKLSDAQSDALTLWANQRDINKEGLGYVEHYWKWDEYQISLLDRQTAKRARINERRYNNAIKEIGRAEKKLDDAKYAWTTTETTSRKKGKKVKKSGRNYDPNQFKNSDDAIAKEIIRREAEK